VQDIEGPYQIVLAVILCVAGALIFWEPVYNKFKDWQLKRAFRLREKADKKRAGRS